MVFFYRLIPERDRDGVTTLGEMKEEGKSFVWEKKAFYRFSFTENREMPDSFAREITREINKENHREITGENPKEIPKELHRGYSGERNREAKAVSIEDRICVTAEQAP